jgi:gamma-tubulin complex component 3
LDDVIDAHARYLKSITRKGLLGKSHMEFTTQLHQLLKTMLAYKEAVDGLYSYSLAESTKIQARSARIESRTAQGRWGITERDDDDDEFDRKRDGPRSRDVDSPMPPPLLGSAGGDDASILSALRQRLRDLALDFRAKVCIFLGDLAYQPDTDLRFLGVTMNWNDVYKITRRSKKRPDNISGATAPSTEHKSHAGVGQADSSILAASERRPRP